MSETKWVLTKDGVRVSGPMTESEAKAQAAQKNKLLESQGNSGSYAALQVIQG